MSKKQLYSPEAERLYVIEQHTLAEIASRLKLNEKTLRSWKDEGDWENKRKQFLASKQSFHEELYHFARLLLKKIREDMEANVPVDANRLYTLGKMIPQLIRVKDYEEASRKAEGDSKQLSNDDLVKIVEEALKK